MNIPKDLDGTIYFYFDTEYEWLVINEKAIISDKYIPLGQLDVKVPFRANGELTQQAISGLESKKAELRVELERSLSIIDGKIQSLLAITHDGDSHGDAI